MTERAISFRLGLVTPVFNDWGSLSILLRRIEELYHREDIAFAVVVVDDGSTERNAGLDVGEPDLSCICRFDVIRLVTNLGHQRAIAIGLAQFAARPDVEAVLVMDSDGEDRPEDITTLCAARRAYPSHAVLARRLSRSEGFVFKLGYLAYKSLFRALTGRAINFGNFSLLPMPAVRRLVYMPELWNNLAAALVKSRLEYQTVPLNRGSRYLGKSKMNFLSLIIHGLSAMSVYTDVIFARILIAGTLLASLTVLGIIIVVLIRLLTGFGVPGWASTMIGDLAIILVQTLVLIVATSLIVLAGRSHRQIIPIIDSPVFIVPDSEPPVITTAKSAADHVASQESSL